MGDLAVPIVVLVLAAFGGAWAFDVLRRGGARRATVDTPLALIEGGAMPSDKARRLYQLSRRAVRVLESLATKDSLVPILTDEERAEIKRIIEQFDQL